MRDTGTGMDARRGRARLRALLHDQAERARAPASGSRPSTGSSTRPAGTIGIDSTPARGRRSRSTPRGDQSARDGAPAARRGPRRRAAPRRSSSWRTTRCACAADLPDILRREGYQRAWSRRRPERAMMAPGEHPGRDRPAADRRRDSRDERQGAGQGRSLKHRDRVLFMSGYTDDVCCATAWTAYAWSRPFDAQTLGWSAPWSLQGSCDGAWCRSVGRGRRSHVDDRAGEHDDDRQVEAWRSVESRSASVLR